MHTEKFKPQTAKVCDENEESKEKMTAHYFLY